MLHVTLPNHIDTYRQSEATVRVDQPLPIGKMTGTLKIHSDQLQQRTFEQTIDVVSRWSRGWLLFWLVTSIGAGYLVREKLETRRLRLKAEINAQKQLVVLDELVRTTVDEDLKHSLAQIRSTLRRAIKLTADPQAITAAVDEAKAKLAQLLSNADRKRQELTQKLSQWRVVFVRSELGIPGLVDAMSQARARLDAQENLLSQGHLTSVEDFFQTHQQELIDLVSRPILTWLSEVETAFGLIGNWPDTSLPPLPEIQRQVSHLRDEQQKVNAVTSLREFVSACATLAATVSPQHIRQQTLSSARRTVESQQPLATDLAAAIAEVERLPSDGCTLDQVAEAVSKLRRALPTVPALELAQRTPVDTDVARQPLAAAPSDWAISIQVPTVPVVSQPIRLQLQYVATTKDATLPQLRVRWLVDGQVAKEGPHGDLNFTFTPQHPGRYVVRAVADAVDRDQQSSAEVLLLVRPDAAARQQDLEVKLAALERIQTCVFGALIAFGGYLIFRGSFLGTVQDVVTACTWGFTVDIGAAKVRELMMPFVPKPPPDATPPRA